MVFVLGTETETSDDSAKGAASTRGSVADRTT